MTAAECTCLDAPGTTTTDAPRHFFFARAAPPIKIKLKTT
jgi:hypothetical protein